MPQSRTHIRSEAVQDILTKVPHWMILWGNTIILILLVFFFILCWCIKYPDTIEAQAIVTSSNPPQKEYARVTGAIDTLLVGDSEKVKASQILAIIENSAKLDDIQYLKKLLQHTKIQKDSFYFPIETMPLLSLGDIGSSFAIFESDYINFTLNKQLTPFQNSISASKLSASEIKQRISHLENQKTLDYKALQYSKNKLNRNKELYNKGVIALQTYEKEEFTYLKEEQRFKNLDITLSQLKQSLGDAYKSTKENEINKEIEQVRLFKSVVQSLNKLKEAIEVWELQYALVSASDGTVSLMQIWNKNQHVQQGDLLFTIIPDNMGTYVAKLKAPIQNSGKIKIGQRVQIRMHNFPEAEYGIVQGTIASMSAIPDAEGFYLIDARLSEKLVTSYDITIPFKNELTGTAEIITEDLRLLERFFYQIKSIFN